MNLDEGGDRRTSCSVRAKERERRDGGLHLYTSPEHDSKTPAIALLMWPPLVNRVLVRRPPVGKRVPPSTSLCLIRDERQYPED